MVTFSGILGQIIPSVFFQGYDSTDEQPNIDLGRSLFNNLLYAESILCVVCLVPLLFVMKSHPPTSPNLPSEND